MIYFRHFLLALFIFGFLKFEANGDSVRVKHHKLIAIPIIFHLPETNWGIGVAGFLRFKQKSEPDSMRYSNVTFAFSVTQLNQIVFSVPFQLWFNRETYNIYGEFGFQHENYLYFGIGNKVPSNFQERYYIHVPRLRINFLKKIYNHLYAGIVYSIDRTDILNLSANGMLINGTVPGSKGGLLSGVGVILKYDSRNSQFYPTKGHFLEFSAIVNNKFTGSDYAFNKYALNMSTYIALPFKQVLALNANAVVNQNNVPFYQMATLGGDAKMRGIYNGRYRDNNSLILQAEYRLALFWKIGAVAFIGVGNVAKHLNQFELENSRLAYGAGLRWVVDKKQQLNVRFDAGFSEGAIKYYFTFAEAF